MPLSSRLSYLQCFIPSNIISFVIIVNNFIRALLFVLVNTQQKNKKNNNKNKIKNKTLFFLNFNIYFYIWSSTAQSQMAMVHSIHTNLSLKFLSF